MHLLWVDSGYMGQLDLVHLRATALLTTLASLFRGERIVEGETELLKGESQKGSKKTRRLAHLLRARGERELAGREDILPAVVYHRGGEHFWCDLGLKPFYDFHVETRGKCFLGGGDD